MILVKIGGGQYVALDKILDDLVIIQEDKLLVHGGNYELNQLSEQLQYPPKMITSKTGQKSRFTDEKTMDMFMMVYAGKINKRIVEKLQYRKTQAIGLSCIDGGIVLGKRRQTIRCVEDGKDVVLHGDYTGSIEEVNTELLTTLLDQGYLPVLTSPILSYDGEALNVDHDKLAMRIAAAINVDTLLFLFEAPGLLKDYQDESTLLTHCALGDIDTVLEYADGRMKKKVLSAKWALEQGIKKVIFADGRIDQPIQKALGGMGTTFTQ